MEIHEIVELDTLADSIEVDAVSKGQSDSDEHRWRVAEGVTKQLAAGYSTRELAGKMSNEGEKKYDAPWVSRQKKVWTSFGSVVTRLQHFAAYSALIQFLPKEDHWDEVLQEAKQTGQSIATIAKRKASELSKAKRDQKQAEKEEANKKKKAANQQRIQAVKETIKPDPIVDIDTETEEADESQLLRRWDREIEGIKKRSLDLIDLAADELGSTDVRVDVRLTINQQIDELINVLNNVKLIVSGTEWNENGN